MSRTTRIFAGALAGIALGVLWPSVAVALHPLADLFLRLVKMIVAPLIFTTLVAGIAGTGDLRTTGRMGLKALIYFEVATTFALAVGLLAVNLWQPGRGMSGALPVTADGAALSQQALGGWDLALHAVPTSVVDAMARGDMLQVVVFATFFGGALATMGTRARVLTEMLDVAAHAMFRVTDAVMLAAPVGVCAAIASTVGGKGVAVLISLGRLVGVTYAALVLFLLVVVVVVTRLVGVPLRRFVAAVREPAVIAFSTASSEAALPKAMTAMISLGVPERVVAFVLPAGYSFNLDGSTLYLSVCSVFVAQMAGVALTPGQQLLMMLTLMLASKGVAGVPRGALVVLAGLLAQFHLPLEAVAVLLGIDQVLDMGRTAVNVVGNCLASVVVARWEGVLDLEGSRTGSVVKGA